MASTTATVPAPAFTLDTPFAVCATALLREHITLSRQSSSPLEDEAALMLHLVERAALENESRKAAPADTASPELCIGLPVRCPVAIAAYVALLSVSTGTRVAISLPASPESAKGVREVVRVVAEAAPKPASISVTDANPTLVLSPGALLAALIAETADAALAAATLASVAAFGITPSCVFVHEGIAGRFLESARSLGADTSAWGVVKCQGTVEDAAKGCGAKAESTLLLAFGGSGIVAEADKAFLGHTVVNAPGYLGTIAVVADLLLSCFIVKTGAESVCIPHPFSLGCLKEPAKAATGARAVLAPYNTQCVQVPRRVYFKHGCLKTALTSELRGRRRAFVITDNNLFHAGKAMAVEGYLTSIDALTVIHHPEIDPLPTLADINESVSYAKTFKPDVIISLGGACPSALAKLTWAAYEFGLSEKDLLSLCCPFTQASRKINKLPSDHDRRVLLTCVSTTVGTGFEVSHGASFTANGKVYSFWDKEATPDHAILDPEQLLTLPKEILACGAFNTLSDSLEAASSSGNSQFTKSYCNEAVSTVFECAVASYNNILDQQARERMHYASSLAGMAAATSNTGVCQALAAQVQTEFGIREGIAKAILLPHVVLFNSAPGRLSPFSADPRPKASDVYESLGFLVRSNTLTEFVEAIKRLQKDLCVPSSFSAAGVSKEKFNTKIESIAEGAIKDPRSHFNTKLTTISDLKAILLAAF